MSFGFLLIVCWRFSGVEETKPGGASVQCTLVISQGLLFANFLMIGHLFHLFALHHSATEAGNGDSGGFLSEQCVIE
jgi:hypothetical protein